MAIFPVNSVLLFKHSWILKNSTAYARMARISSSQTFLSATQICVFEHASNNNPSLKQSMKKRRTGCVGDFWQ